MLKIRRQQLDAFTPIADAAFERRLMSYLRENHPDVVVQLPTGHVLLRQIPEETLSKLVHNGIARARGYGMSWESTLSAFVVLMFVAAPNFDEHLHVQRILRDESIVPNARIEQLWKRTSEEDWNTIAQRYNSATWQVDREG